MILHLDQLTSQELSVQRITVTRCRTILQRKLVVRPESVLDLYVSLPSLDRAVEQCHQKISSQNTHVLTCNNVKHGVLAYKVVQQGSPSLKLHDQKAMEWSGHRAFKHEI